MTGAVPGAAYGLTHPLAHGLTYDLTLAGLAIGSAAALTGIGLIVTYRATGVLNLAHGAVAMVCAYLFRQFVTGWGWPLPVGALVTLLVCAPGLGLLLDRAVFRLLARAGAGQARTLVAGIGVFVLLVGAAVALWGGGAKDDAPVLLGDDPWAQLAVVVALGCLVAAVTRWTRFGRWLRAVVDNRPLAVLSGIPADRVAAAGWAFGSFTAGLTGVLLAPYVRLDPYGLPLLVVEVLAVAVVARLRSLPVAVGTALVLGVAQAQLTRLHPEGWAGDLVQAAGANLFVLALLVAALARPGVGDTDALPPPVAAPRTPPGVWAVTGVLLLLPLGLAGGDLSTAVQLPAFAVILLSLVLVAGRGGRIALGQAAYAGLGALLTGLLAGAGGLPELVAVAVAVPCVAVFGLLTGWPAIRRRGLALALATLAVGVAVSRFVFAQPYATAGVALDRPAGFTGDRAYYALELAVLAGALLLVAATRRGRTGRALAALRDHEPGAEAAGVPGTRLKLLAFTLGAALAALGGALLGMGVRAFDPEAFDPVRGLLWFAAVVTLGADTLLTPVVAAALLTPLAPTPEAALPLLLIGLLATFTGRVPPLLPWLLARLPASVRPEDPARPPAPVAAKGPARPGFPTGPAASGRADGRADARTARPGSPTEPPAGGAAPAPSTGRPARALRSRTGGAGGETGPAGGRALPHRPGADDARTAPTQPPAAAPAPAPAPAHTLAAHHLTLTYPGNLTALDHLTLHLAPAHLTALTGPNGAGKTSLFDCLAGTTRPTSGSVTLDGVDITRLPPHARARLGIARTFQQLAVFPSLTVEENVQVDGNDPADVERALRLLGLAGPVRRRPAAGLPTGALRRVELARALAARPHTLLLDEPSAGLDAAETAALGRVLTALAADGLTVLLVEHDPDLVAALVAGAAGTTHTVRAGRIVS
ncbi:ATP-binding cassette domain-containing protein [Streptomyces sp. NPDC090025]|uniref:ABC transporter permease subunit n=1 Tax=Streptomyces sp. NPDC090025 TaxID=3365922 RepID=UPI003836252B